MIKYCKMCGEKIPEGRIKLGYKDTCVKHSQTQKFTGIVSSAGKTDYEIAIIRDQELAKHIVQLSNIY